uniref:Saccharopine dehydrogenase [NAD(+), L-lysine-forming] n=1 Tax=viral metagenome TaxID=1070528 RepID=A0A6C0DP88_9ZZZZ
MQLDTIYIRNETRINEYRAPIIPKDIYALKQCGYTVYVEQSDTRCFTDSDYEASGAIITNKCWTDFSNSLIVGIKGFTDMDKLDNHVHVYFAHCYKNQPGSSEILNRFSESKSKLYDLEYFLDATSNRIIAFGLYAGIVGCGLGLMQYNHSKNNDDIKNLTYWANTNHLLKDIRCSFSNHFSFNAPPKGAEKNGLDQLLCASNKRNVVKAEKNISIAIIGANGRCGMGVKHILNIFSIPYKEFLRGDKIQHIEDYDIVFNCIHLTNEIPKWFTKETKFTKKIVIIDISCDYSSKYNPIDIYNKPTTWEEPVYKYSEFVDIIAIENLPSLLPFESSNDFSDNLVHLLRLYSEGDIDKYWKNNLAVYNKHISNPDKTNIF